MCICTVKANFSFSGFPILGYWELQGQENSVRDGPNYMCADRFKEIREASAGAA